MSEALLDDLLALRTAAGLAHHPDTVALWLRGPAALDAAERLLPTELFLREGQVRPSLLLSETGVVDAEVLVAALGEDLLLLAEGPGASSLRARAEHSCEGLEARAELDAELDVLSLSGPFAWEPLRAVEGPSVAGLPYGHALHRAESGYLLRTGGSGEFGFFLLAPRAGRDALFEAYGAPGEGPPVRRVSLDALDHCALEAGNFSARADLAPGLTPLELQLQARVSWHKTHPAVAALEAHRREGFRRRLTSFVVAHELPRGALVELDGEEAGAVHRCSYSPSLGFYVGTALLELPVAHSGIDALSARDAGGELRPLRTVSPPFLRTLSFVVHPQRNRWAERATLTPPPSSRVPSPQEAR